LNYFVILFYFAFFIFFHVKENEAKENARVPLHPARRRGGRSARKLASLKQSARFNPSVPPMLSAGQKEIENQKLKNQIQDPF
jgi:hypothetical protein